MLIVTQQTLPRIIVFWLTFGLILSSSPRGSQHNCVLALRPASLPFSNNDVCRKRETFCQNNHKVNTNLFRSSTNLDEIICSGRVVRLAARPFHPEQSKPMASEYTTKKMEQDSLKIVTMGAVGDYNHYRSVFLKNTTDRALSILTVDSLELLKAHRYPVQAGDLGENVLIEGVDFSYFQPGQRYRFSSQKGDTNDNNNDDDDDDVVEIEITEPMVPCANLCKLPYINNPAKSPKQRVATCKELLEVLDQKPGLRGWYARVTKEGRINFQSDVSIL